LTKDRQFYFTLKGWWKRAIAEYNYYTNRPWTLSDVGKFWDTVEDYDHINETLYTYYRRFTNSYFLAAEYLPEKNYQMLDIQARSGKGSLFWYQKEKIKNAVVVDFSDYLTQLADNRLKKSGLNYSCVKVLDFPLPFDNNSFDFVVSYETIEHIYNYESFVNELYRVLTRHGILILTCPNVAWEWVHWLTAIININHSEGPHRFIRRRKLLHSFSENNFDILKENSTIILPFNNNVSIKINELLEKWLPETIKRLVALRRTFVLRKM